MITISVVKRTKYACNIFQKGPNMLAKSKIIAESCDYDFLTNLAKTDCNDIGSHFDHHCNHIWSLLEKISIILGLIVVIIAIIFGSLN